jgi:transcriptional regulator with XRE-family HTH domain
MPRDERMSQPGPEHDPLRWLLVVDDFVEAESLPEEVVADLLAWIDREVRPEVLHHVRLSPRVLAAIVTCLPDASLTPDVLARAERRRQSARSCELEMREAVAEFRAQEPSELLREARELRGVAPEAAADALGLSPGTYREIESGRRPWYTLQVECLPKFAMLLNLALPKLVLGLKITAQRALVAQVRQRAGFALSRCDRAQDGISARLDQLRAAFAMVQDENQAAAMFFRRADQLLASSKFR